MKILKAVGVAAVVTGFVAIGTPAAAVVIYDVNNLVDIPDNAGRYQVVTARSSTDTFGGQVIDVRTTEQFQSWTVGQSGNLHSLQLFGHIHRHDDRTISIYSGGSTDAPGTDFLGSVTLPGAAGPATRGVITFDLSGLNIDVFSGQTFTFGMSVTACTPAELVCSREFENYVGTQQIDTPAYAGGAAFFRSGDLTAKYNPEFDLNFAILIDREAVILPPPPTPVPEPSAWALMILGVAVTGGGLRRRRAAAVPRASRRLSLA